MIYILILVAKIIEVTLATLRMVLITKGERKVGSVIAFVEVTMWILIVNTVLENIMDYPLKIVAYALGFAIGNYLGSVVEEKIGLGVSELQVILLKEHGLEVAEGIREKGFAVTILEGEGKNHSRNILLMYIPRKQIKECVNIITSIQENAVITVTDKKPLYGGHGLIRK